MAAFGGGGSRRRALVLALAGTLGAVPACSSGGGGGDGSGSVGGQTASAAGSQQGTVYLARLASEMEARRLAYLDQSASPPPGSSENVYVQIARMETGRGPLSRAAIEGALDYMEKRRDTADFKANALLRLLYLHGQSALLPSDLKQRTERAFLAFKYWIDEPGKDEMVYWSENHRILFAAAEYLAGHLYPAQVFSNASITGQEHVQRARPRILRWLDERMRFGFSEWYSPVYYEEDLEAVLNLADFAPEAEIRERAAIVLDLVVFDLARLSNRGSFGVTAGRAYGEHKWTGWSQSTGDLIEILFGTRGRLTTRGNGAASAFATSRGYRVPHVLLAIGKDAPARLVDRSRSGLSFGEARAAGIGFSTYEDGIFWWGMGAYVAPETIVLTRRMVNAYDLWHYSYFQPLAALRSVPESLLAPLSSTLSPLTEGSVLSTVNAYTFRTPDAMLSSAQSFRRGQTGFQQHAWQATLDCDALVFTTAPGTFGHDGPDEWTGSASLPRVVQVEDVLVALYNPSFAQRAIFPARTHAFFPRAGFDEVTSAGSWTFGRKGDGYVALYSATQTTWQSSGTFADRELIASGARNAWICEVGRRAEDGDFADFVARVSASPVTVTGAGGADPSSPLRAVYSVAGLGTLVVDWSAVPTLDSSAIPQGPFERFDNPYVQAPFGARALAIRHAGAILSHDHDLGTRTGDGL